MKQAVPILAALAVVGAFSAAVYAQTPDRVIKYRQGIMQAQGWHMGILGGMAKGTRPYDKDVAARSAKYVSQLLEMPWEGFTPGSETGAPTRAKPEIWKDKAKFDKYGQDAQAESVKFAAAAGNGLDALRTAIGPMGRACNNCHDDFQNKELSK
jgi:cytochrome c556